MAPEVREAAAKGIYGGHLPVWWRDLESEKDNEEREDCAEEARAVQRPRCRYGEACDQHAPDHRWKFAHLGDADWDAAEANQACDETSAATEGNAPTQCRPRCRYRLGCTQGQARFRRGNRTWRFKSIEAEPSSLPIRVRLLPQGCRSPPRVCTPRRSRLAQRCGERRRPSGVGGRHDSRKVLEHIFGDVFTVPTMLVTATVGGRIRPCRSPACRQQRWCIGTGKRRIDRALAS